ncbi:tetratricopeptide repeat protein [Maribacter thermophilus]|uniref:tetratricopeptide repeat protein n=1 Tax=Maribacter thermophilus TaxID=1197874 RepID=UPI00069BAEF9|nr:tetratricopeptide repeat protein [Maribacter thermophilus]
MKKLLFLFLFAILNCTAQEQATLDSILNQFSNLHDSLKIDKISGEIMKFVRADSLLVHGLISEQEKIANILNKSKYFAVSQKDKGIILFLKGNYTDARIAYGNAKKFYLKASDSLGYARILNNEAYILFYEGKIEEAQKLTLTSTAIKERNNAPEKELMAGFVALGQYHTTLENYDVSLSYYKKAEKIAAENKDSVNLMKIKSNIGLALQWLNRYPESLEYFNENIQYYIKNGLPHQLGNAYNNIGTTLFEMDSLQRAKEIFNKALKLNLENKSFNNTLFNYNNLGRTELKLKNPEMALVHFKKAGSLINTYNFKISLQQHYLNLSDTYAALKRYNEAYDYRVKHQVIHDSIYSKENADKINELEIKYQTEKKEAEIALQDEEINTLNAQAKVNTLTKGLYAGGMFTFVAVSGLLFFGFKQRIKKNRIAREKQEEIYKQEIAYKKKELTSQTLHLVQKNTFIQELMENLENIKNSPEKFKMEFRRIVMLLKKENASDKDWEVFKTYFSEVHNDFDQKLKTLSADISEKEIRLAAFLRMNLTTKEIAATMNVLPDSILKSKYRLKKKLGLNKETDLSSFLNGL